MTITNMEETWPDQQKYNKKDKHNDKYIQRTPSESAPRDLWSLRLFIRVMWRHDLTNKKKMTKTMTMTKIKTMTKTFRERPQRVILETYNLWDIWSERWGDMTWPTKQAMTKTIQWQRQGQLPIHLENTSKSDPSDLWPLRHLIRMMRRHDQTKKDNDKDKYKYMDNYTDKYI